MNRTNEQSVHLYWIIINFYMRTIYYFYDFYMNYFYEFQVFIMNISQIIIRY